MWERVWERGRDGLVLGGGGSSVCTPDESVTTRS